MWLKRGNCFFSSQNSILFFSPSRCFFFLFFDGRVPRHAKRKKGVRSFTLRFLFLSLPLRCARHPISNRDRFVMDRIADKRGSGCRSSPFKWLNFRDSITLFAADRSKPLSVRSARFRFQRVHTLVTDRFFIGGDQSRDRSINPSVRWLAILSPQICRYNLAQLRAILGLGSQRNMCVTSDWIYLRAWNPPIPRGVAAKTIILGEMERCCWIVTLSNRCICSSFRRIKNDPGFRSLAFRQRTDWLSLTKLFSSEWNISKRLGF